MTVDKINSLLQLDPIVIPHHGWIDATELLGTLNLWVRTGNHTFTITHADGFSSYFRKGTKIRYKDGGSYEYGVVSSSSEGGSTVTTVNLIPNSDYTLHASNTITDRYISYVANPEDFPTSFNFDPSWTNLSGGTRTARWKIVEPGIIFIEMTNLSCTFAGGNIDFTLPVTPLVSASVTRHVIGLVQCLDSAAGQYAGSVNNVPSSAVAHPRVFNASGTYVTLDRITSTVPITWGASDELNIQCTFLF